MSSDKNMHKDQTIVGMPSPSEWSRMYVDRDGKLYPNLCPEKISEKWQSILKQCGFFPVVVTCIMQGDHTKPTIIATYSEPRKTLEKNGVT